MSIEQYYNKQFTIKDNYYFDNQEIPVIYTIHNYSPVDCIISYSNYSNNYHAISAIIDNKTVIKKIQTKYWLLINKSIKLSRHLSNT